MDHIGTGTPAKFCYDMHQGGGAGCDAPVQPAYRVALGDVVHVQANGGRRRRRQSAGRSLRGRRLRGIIFL